MAESTLSLFGIFLRGTSYRGVYNPDSRSAPLFKWTKIDLLESGEICASHVMIYWTGVFIIRDLVVIKIAIAGVP